MLAAGLAWRTHPLVGLAVASPVPRSWLGTKLLAAFPGAKAAITPSSSGLPDWIRRD